MRSDRELVDWMREKANDISLDEIDVAKEMEGQPAGVTLSVMESTWLLLRQARRNLVDEAEILESWLRADGLWEREE